MIIPKYKGWVGSWEFNKTIIIDVLEEVTTLTPLLDMFFNALTILNAAELLIPKTITFSDWIKQDRLGNVKNLNEKPSLEMDLHSDLLSSKGEFIQYIINNLKKDFNTSEFFYPLDIEINGQTIINNLDNTKESFSDMVWLLGQTPITQVLYVNTQTDVWLPYSLTGEEQTKLSKINSNRLAKALEDIEAKLQIEATWEPRTKYATINKFTLDNLKYEDNSLVI